MYACTQNHRFSLLLTHTRYVCMHGYVCLYAWLIIYCCFLYLTMHAWLCLSKQRDLRRPVLLDPLSAIFTSPIKSMSHLLLVSRRLILITPWTQLRRPWSLGHKSIGHACLGGANLTIVVHCAIKMLSARRWILVQSPQRKRKHRPQH